MKSQDNRTVLTSRANARPPVSRADMIVLATQLPLFLIGLPIALITKFGGIFVVIGTVGAALDAGNSR